MNEPIALHLRGHVPSKKNNWRPRKGGGIVLDEDAREGIDRIAMQIPGRFRDLKLESPQINFHFLYERANWDRDNAVTTLLDVLVEYGVLQDDNIKRCNGLICIHPAEPADYDGVTIIIIPRDPEPPSVTRYAVVRRRNPRVEPVIQTPIAPLTLDDFEELEDAID